MALVVHPAVTRVGRGHDEIVAAGSLEIVHSWHMRKALLVVAWLTACSGGSGKAAKCEHARDVIADQMELRAKDAIAGVSDSTDAATLRRESQREVGMFRANFVAACDAAPDFDASCLEDTKKMSKACEQALQPMMRAALKLDTRSKP